MPDVRGSPGDSEQESIPKKLLGALTEGLGAVIRAAASILVDVFRPDDPPPRETIPINSRRRASITGAVLALITIYAYVTLSVYKSPEARRTAVEALGGPWIALSIAGFLLLGLMYAAWSWGEHCDDRAKYKIILSSLWLVLVVFLFVLILLFVAGKFWPS